MKSFVLIVADHDRREFTVEGPMADDNPWNKAVVTAQEAGRQVNCHVPGEAAQHDMEVAAAHYAREFRYTRVPPGSLIKPGGRDR